MSKVAGIAVFFLISVVFIASGQVILNMVSDQHLGNYYFLYRNASDSTDFNTSGSLNLSTQRTSTRASGNLTVTFTGGNETDTVSVGGYLVGNFSGASPKTFTVAGAYIDVPALISYSLTTNNTNVTDTFLVYYSYDGCEYSETVCDTLNTAENMTEPAVLLTSFVPLLLAVLMIGVGLVGLVRGN